MRDATIESISGMRAACKACDWVGQPSVRTEDAVKDRDAHNTRYHLRGGLRCDMCRKKPAKIIPNLRSAMSELPGVLCRKCDKKTTIDARVGLKELFG